MRALLLVLGTLSVAAAGWIFLCGKNIAEEMLIKVAPRSVNASHIVAPILTSQSGHIIFARELEELQAIPTTRSSIVELLGYYNQGDIPPINYVASRRPCSLNSGAGDGGSQIPSSDGNCWNASIVGALVPEWWGAKHDNLHDDTGAINSMFRFAASFSPAISVQFGPYNYRHRGTLTCPASTCVVNGVEGLTTLIMDNSAAGNISMVIGLDNHGQILPTVNGAPYQRTFNHHISNIAFGRVQASSGSTALKIVNSGVVWIDGVNIVTGSGYFETGISIVADEQVQISRTYIQDVVGSCIDVVGYPGSTLWSGDISVGNFNRCSKSSHFINFGDFVYGIYEGPNNTCYNTFSYCITIHPRSRQYFMSAPSLVSGGRGYKSGDFITLENTTPGIEQDALPIIVVTSVSDGVITNFELFDNGTYSGPTLPAQSSIWNQTKTSGEGSGATFRFKGIFSANNTAKFARSDYDTAPGCIEAQYYNNITIDTPYCYVSSGSGQAIKIVGDTAFSLNGGKILSGASSVDALVQLGDGTAIGAVTNGVIGGGVMLSGDPSADGFRNSNKAVVVKAHTGNISLSGMQINGISDFGILGEGENTNISIGWESINFHNVGHPYVLSLPFSGLAVCDFSQTGKTAAITDGLTSLNRGAAATGGGVGRFKVVCTERGVWLIDGRW